MTVVVAVIGAGAAGLVASRHLAKCGLQPCVFECHANKLQSGLGGAWNVSSGKMWDNLTPNLSKYTCCFSELPWSHQESSSPTAAFVSRNDMHRYLESYASAFLDPTWFRYGCTVTNIKQKSSSNTKENENKDGLFQQRRYQVEWAEPDGVTKSEEFDGVIVATGFFSTPVMPEGLLRLPLMNTNDTTDTTSKAEITPNQEKIIHSSEYKSPSVFCNQTVAVCGASFSALEIAADVRKQASKVISIVPRIPWVMPRYVPVPTKQQDSDKTGRKECFAPLDTVLYRRSRDAPQTPAVLTMDEASCQAKHAFLQSLSGSRKQTQSPLGIPTDTSSPPMVAISDDYLNLVIDGNIEVIKGRVARAIVDEDKNDDDDNNKMTVELEDGQCLTGMDRIIACTGYRSQLSFLEPTILETLEYDETDGYAPLSLCYDAFHPKLPNLGFVGMYKGPYFGIMELQARLLAGMMSGQVTPSEHVIDQALEDSRIIRDKSNRAQFPRFDYVGMMDSLAELVDLVPSKEFGAKGMMVSPAFYQTSDEISQQCKKEIQVEWGESDDEAGSANVAKIALNALVGQWRFERSITHFLSTDPPQRVTGQIKFSFMQPPPNVQEWNTVLYDEQGIFHMPGGRDLDVFRQYEYEYKDDGILEIYFVELGKRAHLFLSLKFSKQENGYWVATNDHLCIKDLYKATFKIKFDGIGAEEIVMTYRVKGPSKDYESVTELRPL